MERGSYERFRRQALGEAPAGAAVARSIPSGLSCGELSAAPEAELWALHERLLERHRAAGAQPAAPVGAQPAAPATLLDVKVELAQRLLGPCRLCWLRCPVDRRAGELGFCRLGANLRPYQDFVHLGEELELIPTHAVFLAGCNYRCVYCSDWDHVVAPDAHPEVGEEALGRSIAARRQEGAHSVSFIGGLPDVNLPGILRALRAARTSVPVVWNSNMSSTPEAQALLEGVVDGYVADLKYGSEACAHAGSGVRGSLEVTQKNLRLVRDQAYLIVRHLVVPGHVDCCALPVLDWLAEHLPGVRVNLMDQYAPTPEVQGTAWDRRPSADELERARAHAAGLDLDLVGPGRLEGSPRTDGSHPAADPVAHFEAKITIGKGGEVVLENLPPDLLDLVQGLGDAEGLAARGLAAEPWREDPPKS